IHPEGDAGIVKFGPFDGETFTSQSAVAVGTEGELTLARSNGYYAPLGQVELAPAIPEHAFDTVFVGVDHKCDPGSSVTVQVRVTEADGRVSRWQSVQRESELVLERPATSFQVRVVMHSFTGRETPRVRSVVVQV